MRALVATPWSGSAAVELSANTWRKKLLPIGQVNYKGRMLHFDRPYLEDLAQAFNSGAYSQVPLQLADSDNKHNHDPERYRGEVVRVDVEPDGLYATVATTPDGNKLLMTNPKLGVSARIIEDYERSDGNYYPKAIQHVLATLDPRIPNLGEWQPVEMSNADVDMVIDLSTSQFAGEPAPEPAGGGLGNEDLRSVLAEFLEPDELQVYDEHGEEALLEYLEVKYGTGKPQVSDPATAGPGLNGDAASVQFANDDLGQAVELAQLQAAARAVEDAQPLARRSEDRLQTALARIQAGTYTASHQQVALGFAADDYAPAGGPEYVGCSCGAIGVNGERAAIHHLAGCDATILSTDDVAAAIQGGLYRDISQQVVLDANGHAWLDQYGQPMNLTALVESSAGQRLTRDDPFQGLGRNREVLQAQRQATWGDPQDPDDPGLPFSDATRQAARAYAEQMGLAPRSAAAARDAAIGQMAFRGRSPRPVTISAAMDISGTSIRDRAERVRSTGIYPAQHGGEDGQPVAGSLPAYTYGMRAA